MNDRKLKRRALHLALGAALAPAAAFADPALPAPLALSTQPAGSAYKLPAPNVIVSVDDSGSMGPGGMSTLRAALLDTFSEAKVPDGAIRLAWQAMNSCPDIPNGGACGNRNMLRVLDKTHRKNFTDWVRALATANGTTPSHRMLFNAGRYLQSAPGVDSPWASIPGKTQAPMLGCRRAYNLFMTDGGWNDITGSNNSAMKAIGNKDGTSSTLPDGVRYDATDAATAIYRDRFGGSASDTYFIYRQNYALPTLADIAFHFWATDLQPGIEDKVLPRIAQAEARSFTKGNGAKVVLPEYWNPRNDPATWQHMTTYTVGFLTAANWNGVAGVVPKFGSDTWTGGAYDALVTGEQIWSNNPILGVGSRNPYNTSTYDYGNPDKRMPELWHMALNSRGKFIPAPTSSSLATAFKDVLDTIVAAQTVPVTSMAVSALDTRTDAASYEAGYETADWSGKVTAYKIAKGSARVDGTGLWAGSQPGKPTSTASLMDAKGSGWPAARVVLTARPADGTDTSGPVEGVPFTASRLKKDQLTALKTLDGVNDDKSTERIAFLRGDRSKEIGQPNGIFRQRGSRQGDIVNSRIWFTDGRPSGGHRIHDYQKFVTDKATRPSMLYVGGNDGMLHGFDAASGEERLAYVPLGLYPRLSRLSDPDYRHAYFVDGSPLTGDAHVDGGWRTCLAGFLGAGGKGYFVLDVSDPAGFGAANAAAIVRIDTTASAHEDLGHIFGEPATEPENPRLSLQITQMNDGRWALVTGNGYNSTSQYAALLVQYLDGGKELKVIRAGAPGGNGLSTPRLVDLNGDRLPDIAYAGDLQGQLWKFDLRGDRSDDWKVAYGGAPLFAARSAAGTPQPITAAPMWLAHPEGGLMVVFGTGRNITDADRSSAAVQSLYGIYDNTPITRNAPGEKPRVQLGDSRAATGGRTELVEQTIPPAPIGKTLVTGSALWTLSDHPVPYTGPGARRGWYVDLPDQRERLLDNLIWRYGNLLTARTKMPAIGGENSQADEESCNPAPIAGEGRQTTFNGITGARPRSQVYGHEAGAGTTAGARLRDDGLSVAIDGGIRPDGSRALDCVAQAGKSCDPMTRPPGRMPLHPAWYQLQ